VDIGVVFPQTEIGTDVGTIRDYALAADELGFAHALAYDHVLGADPAVHKGWDGPYDIRTTFHEPFVDCRWPSFTVGVNLALPGVFPATCPGVRY
jgi:hypothetical protein